MKDLALIIWEMPAKSFLIWLAVAVVLNLAVVMIFGRRN